MLRSIERVRVGAVGHLRGDPIDRPPQLRGIALRVDPAYSREFAASSAGERTELHRRGDGEPHILFARPISHT